MLLIYFRFLHKSLQFNMIPTYTYLKNVRMWSHSAF